MPNTETSVFSSFPFMQRNFKIDKTDHRFARTISSEQRRRLPIGRRSTVYIRTCRSTYRHVQIQIQADETDQDV